MGLIHGGGRTSVLVMKHVAFACARFFSAYKVFTKKYFFKKIFKKSLLLPTCILTHLCFVFYCWVAPLFPRCWELICEGEKAALSIPRIPSSSIVRSKRSAAQISRPPKKDRIERTDGRIIFKRNPGNERARIGIYISNFFFHEKKI